MTIVDVAKTIRPFETLATNASVVSIGRINAGCSVLARITGTSRRCYVTGCTLPAGWTVTREAISAILTSSSVTTSTRLAMATSKGTSFSFPTVSANAGEVGDTVDACAIVTAR